MERFIWHISQPEIRHLLAVGGAECEVGTDRKEIGEKGMTLGSNESKEARRKRQADHRQRLLAKGLTQVTVTVPISRREDLKAFAARLCAEGGGPGPADEKGEG